MNQAPPLVGLAARRKSARQSASGHLGLYLFGNIRRHFVIVRELHRVLRAALGERTQLVDVAEHVGERHDGLDGLGVAPAVGALDLPRSEEHTSELQSLMRISYADLRLTKKQP